MRIRTIQSKRWASALACAAALAIATCAFAQPGGGGGSHGSGGVSRGGGGGGGVAHGGGGNGAAHLASPRASYGQFGHGGLPATSRFTANHGHSGYGRGGGYGYGYRGYGYRGYGGWYGYPWGALAFGAYVSALPGYYQTLWWGGLPYYYADDTYFLWNPRAASYEVVPPPADDAADGVPPDAPSAGAAPMTEPFAYPQQGQSAEQLAKDRYECHRWAADQTGFDPTQASGGVPPAEAAGRAGAYRRAQAACLSGRGYSVK